MLQQMLLRAGIMPREPQRPIGVCQILRLQRVVLHLINPLAHSSKQKKVATNPVKSRYDILACLSQYNPSPPLHLTIRAITLFTMYEPLIDPSSAADLYKHCVVATVIHMLVSAVFCGSHTFPVISAK